MDDQDLLDRLMQICVTISICAVLYVLYLLVMR